MGRLRLARDLGVAPKRLHGWEPRTIQRGYDHEGNQVPIADAWEIVSEVEPEWDDDQRALMSGLVEFERGLCACGWHESMANDDANNFTFAVKRCPVCAGSERYHRILHERDERVRARSGDKPPASLPDPADGRKVMSLLMGPDEQS